jgi:hypothetical protein
LTTVNHCSQEATVFRADQKFIKVNKTTKLNEIKINLLKLFDLEYVNIINVSHNINECISFFDCYVQNCVKNKLFIPIRDIFLHVIFSADGAQVIKQKTIVNEGDIAETASGYITSGLSTYQKKAMKQCAFVLSK